MAVRPYHTRLHSAGMGTAVCCGGSASMPVNTHTQATREAIVTVRGSVSEMSQTVETRSHRFMADEPVEFGGNETGPTPYELLVGALGS